MQQFYQQVNWQRSFFAFPVNRLCQPSQSLFVRTLHIYTQHVFVGHVVEVIHVFLMYVQRFLTCSVLARSLSLLNMCDVLVAII